MMNKTPQSIALGLIACLVVSMPAASGEETDTREVLNLTASERHHLLSNMREMLKSLQGITTGIGKGDRDLIIESARTSGKAMPLATPTSIRQKVPADFRKLGAPTHAMFEELSVRAKTEDMSALAEFTGRLMRQCVACHDKYRAN